MKYFICGFTGSGKSTLLAELASDQNLKKFEFLDLDEFILKQQSKYLSLGLLIEEEGFSYFRSLEEKALNELSTKINLIVSLGGGALSLLTLKILKSWHGLWLNTDFDICYERIRLDKNRPITKMSKKELNELYLKRSELYSEHQSVSNHSQVVDIILSH